MDQIRSKVLDELWILIFFEVRVGRNNVRKYLKKNGWGFNTFVSREISLNYLNLYLQQWYTAQIQMLCNWLSERLDHSLHLYQCTCLAHIVKKIYSNFELQGVMEEKLNTKTYQTIDKRMKTEEATCALTMSAQNEE